MHNGLRGAALLAIALLAQSQSIPCSELYPSQLCCTTLISRHSQPPTNCSDGRYVTACFARPGVECDNTTHAPDATNSTSGAIPCGGHYYSPASALSSISGDCVSAASGSYSYYTALSLSVFGGMLGFDRFYLGYYGIGLVKFFTFGFFLVGQLIDIVLIATQNIGPADGSGYYSPYYGDRIHTAYADNSTLVLNSY